MGDSKAQSHRAKREFISHSPEETIKLGEQWSGKLLPGSCLALIGELGAGKTTLIKGLARGLGIPEVEVTSPTFILVREYRGGQLPLFHIDAYRISRPEELPEIGVEEYLLSKEGITAIEWADRIRLPLLQGCIEIRMEILSPKERRISISGLTRAGASPAPTDSPDDLI